MKREIEHVLHYKLPGETRCLREIWPTMDEALERVLELRARGAVVSYVGRFERCGDELRFSPPGEEG